MSTLRLPKGTRAVLTTDDGEGHGGTVDVELHADYVPTFGCWFRSVSANGTLAKHAFYVPGDKVGALHPVLNDAGCLSTCTGTVCTCADQIAAVTR